MKIEIPIDAPELPAMQAQLSLVQAQLADLRTQMERLISMAQLTQDQINALATAISTAVANIRSDIEALKAQIPPDVDTSALDASVSALEALDVENPPTP